MRYLFVTLMIVLIAPLIMRGCSDDGYKNNSGPASKQQMDTINKAGEVNQQMQDANKQQSTDWSTRSAIKYYRSRDELRLKQVTVNRMVNESAGIEN